MYKNYFFLNRLTLELNNIISGFNLVEVFSQEKNEIILHFNSKEDYYLIINVNPGNPHILLKDEYHRAKKNTLDFYSDFLPSSLKKILIAEKDRIIKFEFENISLFFLIRGKFTNFILIENKLKIISPFKNVEEESLIEIQNELFETKFISYFNNILNELNSIEISTLRKEFPIIGKEIESEIKSRYEKGDLHSVLNEIKDENINVGFNFNEFEIKISPSSFISFSFEEVFSFNTLIEAQNFYFGKKRFFDKYNAIYKLISNKLEKDISKLSVRLNGLLTKIDSGTKEELYNKYAILLLINLHKINRQRDKIEIEDIYNNNQLISINLDSKLTLQKNAEKYFEKSRNEKISFEKSKELYTSTEKEFNRLKKIYNFILTKPDIKDLEKIMKELKIQTNFQKDDKIDLKSKFKHYLIENKYHLYAGKDSNNNDVLTTQFAKQNDLWFHARSVSGSHVVLRIDNSKEIIPKSIIKKAASIAAFHSKAKTTGMFPVAYTQKKYVVKKKGMAPGKVALLKEEVVIVKPEIPDDCEFISND